MWRFLTFPEAAWELSLGIYLIANGFRSDAVLFTHVRRDARAERRAVSPRHAVASS